jgi:hypothetical protein
VLFANTKARRGLSRRAARYRRLCGAWPGIPGIRGIGLTTRERPEAALLDPNLHDARTMAEEEMLTTRRVLLVIVTGYGANMSQTNRCCDR